MKNHVITEIKLQISNFKTNPKNQKSKHQTPNLKTNPKTGNPKAKSKSQTSR
jgi:hypothetical protein